ncbi:SDR family oxidoreductase [Gordonia hydrophobica]|uniref:SDR family oxidoreductase n=1 Tax=Gordonia hydrophobica TaxID=40516 RepID=A0ABZ2TW89_9ACTN|nr:SDR family oxidoreductase [Gordonia hydrophobica]MBM7365821.1 NAD(P)-dependent dehydrogenase (short-subunit alcohol dehydrogenase family) [Gordonia hydrophobica]
MTLATGTPTDTTDGTDHDLQQKPPTHPDRHNPMSAAPTVVITGAARGIGAAIGGRFASAEHRVIGVDLDIDRLTQTVACWTGDGHRCVEGDAASHRDVAAACDLADGRLSTFVANAGFAKAGDSVDYAPEDWDAMLRVHLTAAMVGAQESAARSFSMKACAFRLN